MPEKYTYFLILLLSLAVPLALSFDKKVAFYKKWKFVFPAMLLPAVFYIVWDIIFTNEGIWQFNDTYILGIKIFGIPLEEILFFFVVPYCCMFIYACIRAYFPKIKYRKMGDILLQMIAVCLLLTIPFIFNLKYPLYTFSFLSFAIILLTVFKKRFHYFSATYFLIAYIIILLPFLAVNGFLTALPVVKYNDLQNLGIRITTIPVEDIFYGMLLILMNVVLYEKLQDRFEKKTG